MNTIKYAVKQVTKRSGHGLARVVTLALGLAFGIILLSEVLYYYSYDRYYPDADRLYLVEANIIKAGEKPLSYPQTSGGVAKGLMSDVPGIECATRTTFLANDDFYTDKKELYRGKFILADEFFYDVQPQEMIEGNAKTILSTPMQCMISSDLAKKMKGNVIGQSIDIAAYPNQKLQIMGVFKTQPENSNYKYDAVVSLCSIKNFMWDGSENWFGNDRYFTVVKLKKGVDPDALAPAVRQMQIKYQDIEKVEKEYNAKLNYRFSKVVDYYPKQYKSMILILTAIALAVLMVAILNYLMLTMNALVKRAKESAILKCYGAGGKQLHSLIYVETALVFAIAVVVALFLIYLLKPLVEARVGHSLEATLNVQVVLPVLLLLLLLLALVAYIPGCLFARTPVALAFRNFRQKQHAWKRVLLAVQFISVSFVLTFLLLVVKQYEQMLHADHGYQTKQVYYTGINNLAPEKIEGIVSQLRMLPGVHTVALGMELPTRPASGNNVFMPGDKKELFNVADMYYVDDHYLEALNIQVKEGVRFDAEKAVGGDIIISKKFKDLLILNSGWKDGVLGKNIGITEHVANGEYLKIVGIYDDIVIGSIAQADARPSFFLYMPSNVFYALHQKNNSFLFNIIIRLNDDANNSVLEAARKIIQPSMLRGEVNLKSLEDEQHELYNAQRGLRDSLFVGGGIVLILSLIGVVGFLDSDLNSKRKAMAIRRINGASMYTVLLLFVRQLLYVIVPCLVVGNILSWYVGVKWMERFVVKTEFSVWLYLVVCLLILLFVVAVSAVKCLRSITANPASELRCE